MGSAATAAALQLQPEGGGNGQPAGGNGLLACVTTFAVDTAGPSQGGDGSGTETGGVPPPGIKAHLPPGTKAGDASGGGVPPPGIMAHLPPGTKAGDASGGGAYGGVFAHEATKFQYREAKRKVRQSQKVRRVC